MKVVNLNGVEIDFDVAVEFMNDEIREAVCIDFRALHGTRFFHRLRENICRPVWRVGVKQGKPCILIVIRQ